MIWFIIFDNNILYVNNKISILYIYKFIFKLHQILFHNNIMIFDYNMFNFKIYLTLKLWSI